MRTLQELWNDEGGLIVSAELVLIMTVGVLAMVVGLNAVASSLNQELNDVAGAFGALNQSYSYNGFVNPANFGTGGFGVGFGNTCGSHAFVAGSGYLDTGDFCDCSEIVAVGGAVKSDAGAGAESGGAALSGGSTTVGGAVEVETTPHLEVEPGCAECEEQH